MTLSRMVSAAIRSAGGCTDGALVPVGVENQGLGARPLEAKRRGGISGLKVRCAAGRDALGSSPDRAFGV